MMKLFIDGKQADTDQTTAVYLAEPVADVIAVTCTAILFATQFRKALHKLEASA